ncbi:hypothetical protein D3C85_1270070 [compost metagenome]
MVEAEAGLARVIQRRPIEACRFQQGISADDIGLDKLGRTGNRAVDVGLCGQMHDCIRLMFTQDSVDLITIANIDTLECITRVLADRG